MTALILAISAAGADAILSGTRRTEARRHPPRRLPARAYLAVTGTGTVVGECELGVPTKEGAEGWLMPVSRPKRYRAPRPVTAYGLAKIPRSFRYRQAGPAAA